MSDAHMSVVTGAAPAGSPEDAQQGPETNGSPATDADYDRLMRAHLTGVFNERDPNKRLAALRELYLPDATLFEPDRAVSGHQAISEAVGALQASLPPHFVFSPDGSAVGHHGLACLKWRAGPPGGPPAVTGMDVAQVEHGLIKTLHVLLDPAPGR